MMTGSQIVIPKFVPERLELIGKAITIYRSQANRCPFEIAGKSFMKKK